ncbi:MAG: GatB/YqeY domain-containing protein [Candidatus Eisenbacteria bacterium]|nr:GatB/YqeY domain-containing protein [Candidatus Eisenbacteria bacterium]
MGLLERLDSDMVAAAKAREAERLNAIRFIRSELKNRRIELGSDLSEEDAVDVVARVAKKLREAVDQFEQAGREDIAGPERRKLEVVESYLPEGLSEDELRALVADAIDETGAGSMKDLGSVMKTVMPKVKGRADGNDVRRIATEILS